MGFFNALMSKVINPTTKPTNKKNKPNNTYIKSFHEPAGCGIWDNQMNTKPKASKIKVGTNANFCLMNENAIPTAIASSPNPAM